MLSCLVCRIIWSKPPVCTISHFCRGLSLLGWGPKKQKSRLGDLPAAIAVSYFFWLKMLPPCGKGLIAALKDCCIVVVFSPEMHQGMVLCWDALYSWCIPWKRLQPPGCSFNGVLAIGPRKQIYFSLFLTIAWFTGLFQP